MSDKVFFMASMGETGFW